MKEVRAELHVHTVLSPCASVEMIPPLIVQTALERGLDLIAITDHNASANAAAVIKAASGSGLTVLPGMELQTREDVHLLCLFDTLEQLSTWQATVDEKLPEKKNNIEFFGEQFVVDSTGDFIRREERLLLTSTSMTLEQATEGVRKLGGLPIPAHVDRQANGLIPILGIIPPDANFDALEISGRITIEEARTRFAQIREYPLIQSGDVHHLGDFLGVVRLSVEAAAVAEIRLAFRGLEGRNLSLSSTT
jgi:PHP family Zn ribbon phosphoesterase